ncbi:5-formyltetrahydrofolate cyclo-ligase [uncultured Cohaesibacter sp.]|uniref:5-formyltetrahydrofolate cyclo-ligase n=1 Tax=uncultured Cohaesibacter sp. TaxID=1002546 RepID=UPI0029C806A9|nr:5-formyltetrahydrofolate cyclo-ligase [uncultured Cohaesibacter sp.]
MDDIATRDSKRDARRRMRSLRNAISPDDHATASAAICNNLLKYLAMASLPGSACIGLFSPVQSEVNVALLEAPLRARGCRLALPVTVGATGMIFRLWEEGAGLVDAGYGTVGPDVSAPELLPDCLLMPLLAFDSRCNRLGYGAGHYDRYISERIIQNSRPHLVGLAFALQKLDKIPVGEYDLPLDAILTEKEIVVPA